MVRNTFEFINSIFNNVHYNDFSTLFNGRNIVLSKIGDRTVLSCDVELNKSFDELYFQQRFGLIISNSSIQLQIPNGEAFFDSPLNIGQTTQRMDIRLKSCYSLSIDWDIPQLMRVVLPIDKENWIGDIRSFGYKEDKHCRLGLLKIILNDILFHIYPYKFEDKEYLIIENYQQILKKDIMNMVFSICVGLGFFTGTIWMCENTIVAYENDEFQNPIGVWYQALRPSIKGGYSVFSTNMHSIVDSLKMNTNTKYASDFLLENGFLRGKIDWLQPDFIDRWVNLIHNNDSLRRSVVLLIEASNYPLEFQVPMYCVALETITGIVMKDENKTTSTPIPTTIFNQTILPSLINSLECEAHKEGLSEDRIEILRRKLKSLNQPTNATKLSKPFDTLQYRLTEEEMEAIKNRNRFLHGSLFGLEDDKIEFDKLINTAIRLHKLCCVLLLKLSQFGSYMLNNPVLWGFEEECRRGDLPIIEI